MKNLLCKVPIFSGLNGKALKILLENAERTVVLAGEMIVREGEVNDSVYLIEAGEVTIIKNFVSANPVVLATLGPGDFFGEMCILETLPRSATAKAAKETTVVSVASSAFYRLFEKMPKQHSILLLNIGRDLSRRLRYLDELYAGRHYPAIRS